MRGFCETDKIAFRRLPPIVIGGTGLLLVLLSGCAVTPYTEDLDEVKKDVAARVGADPQLISGNVDAKTSEALASLLTEELTEQRAVQIALLNNRSVIAIYQMLGVARADLIQAGLLRNPVFSGDAKFSAEATEIEFGLSQPFLDLFLLPLRRRVAEFALITAEAEVTRTLVQLAYDVRRSFVTIRATQDQVELRRQVLRATEASRDVMQQLHQAGNVTDPQLTIEQAAAAQARLALAEAERVEIEAREKLNLLLGLWGKNVGWRIKGRLADMAQSDLSSESVESRSVAASLGLRAARARIDSAAQLSGLASWESALSTAEVGVAGKHETSDDWGFGPAAAVSIPIFDFGQGSALRASSELRQRLAEYFAVGVEVRSTARLFRERSSAFRQRAAYLREVLLPLRSRLTRETLQRFNAMQIGAFEVMLARQQEVETAAEYLTALRDAWLSQLDAAELLAGNLNHARIDAFEESLTRDPVMQMEGH